MSTNFGLDRRRFLAGGLTAAAGAAALAVAGCGDDDDKGSAKPGGTSGGGASPTAAAVKETPVKGGTLNAGKIAELNFKGGLPYVTLAENAYLQSLPFEPIIQYTSSLDPELVLAEKYEYNADRSKLSITLKQGVTFHNGSPLTTDDVIFGIDLMRNPAKYQIVGAIQIAAFIKFFTDLKKVDQRTIEFTFDKPRPNMNDFFAQMRITSAATYDKLLTGSDVQGTGPYAFKQWRPGQGFRFEANKNWHLTSKVGGPYLDAIDVKLFADTDAVGLSYEAGDLDVVNGAVASEAKKFRDLTRVSIKTGLLYCGLNVTNPQLKDARVRQALMWAVDRKRLVEELGENFGTITNQPWPSTSPAFDKALEAPFYDPAKAKQLLQQAGFTQSGAIKIEHRPTNAPQAAVLKENFEAIGVKIELSPQEANAFTTRLRNRELKDMWITTHAFSQLTPLTNFQQTIPYAAENPSYYVSADYTDIRNKLETLDPLSAGAKEQYARFNKLWVEDPWMVTMQGGTRIDLYSKKARGFEDYTISPTDDPAWGKVWKKG